MEEQYLYKSLHLSKKAEKHIRKHYNEFGFLEPKQFTSDEIIRIARNVVSKADRTFIHQHRNENSLIFLRNDILLIIDAKRYSIKTLFKIFYKEYIGLKLQRKFWIEITKN